MSAPNIVTPAGGEHTDIRHVDETQLIVDDAEVAEDDSSELGGTTSSIASSIWNFQLENGRTYHRYKEGNLQHELCLLTLDRKLGLAPPNDENSKVNRVLDLGTGTGLWAIDFGDAHPDAEVLGVDLSPPAAEVPPNVAFEVDDVEEPWAYTQPFDYIHSRFMTSSISNWEKYIKNSFDNLTPGGYFELLEVGGQLQSDDNTLRPDSAVVTSVDVMKEVGFVDIVMTKYKWPMNSWPKDPKHKLIGTWSLHNNLEGIEGWTMAAYTRALNWKKEEVQAFLVDVRNGLKDKSMHAYMPIYAIYGRKPE
ncbi:putative methyltransferase tdiE [Colletotrichum sp. SAR 10_86]|nr:putative methyltransferase tdiE [Colletotrichum sp. SAR 10_86]KAJ5004531.1 putative methyltransferase tdiE [Colletotrichum sp. SAR 10_66]